MKKKPTSKNIVLDFPLTENEIKHLSEDSIQSLIDLDKNGLLIGSGENIQKFKQRLLSISSEINELKNELEKNDSVELFLKVRAKYNTLIDSKLFKEPSDYTSSNYNFSINWVPGFFLNKGLGFLTGGCSISSETGFSLFLIKSAFSKNIRWLWYNRNEILSHELCHIARTPINDNSYEEFFAYKLSFSKFRNYFGNCFQKPIDSILLLCPILLLLLIQIMNSFLYLNLPIYIFWILALVYPIFLLVRNQYYRNYYFKAVRSLKNAYGNSIQSDSILFRCNSNEIKKISQFINTSAKLKKWIISQKDCNLKWKIIFTRFIR